MRTAVGKWVIQNLQSIASAFISYHWYLLSPKWLHQENVRAYRLWRPFCLVRVWSSELRQRGTEVTISQEERARLRMGLMPVKPWVSSVGTTKEASSWGQGGGLHVAFLNPFIKLCQQRSILLVGGYPKAILILFYYPLRPEGEIKEGGGVIAEEEDETLEVCWYRSKDNPKVRWSSAPRGGQNHDHSPVLPLCKQLRAWPKAWTKSKSK